MDFLKSNEMLVQLIQPFLFFFREIFKYFNRKEIESSKTINWKRRAWKHVNTVRVNCGPLALADNVISDKIPFFFFAIFSNIYIEMVAQLGEHIEKSMRSRVRAPPISFKRRLFFFRRYFNFYNETNRKDGLTGIKAILTTRKRTSWLKRGGIKQPLIFFRDIFYYIYRRWLIWQWP